jgi:hypothetical protein
MSFQRFPIYGAYYIYYTLYIALNLQKFTKSGELATLKIFTTILFVYMGKKPFHKAGQGCQPFVNILKHQVVRKISAISQSHNWR